MKAVLDIETRKVAVDPPYYPNERPNQRPVTKRWQVFMVGVALVGYKNPVRLFFGEEERVLSDLGVWLVFNEVEEVVYSATRQFDEMVLKGRFINARRELLEKPGPWPHLYPDRFRWTCLKPEPNPDPEGSRLAPWNYDNGKKQEVIKHCRNDVERLLRRAT